MPIHHDGMMMYSCIHIVLLWMLLKEISSQVLTNFGNCDYALTQRLKSLGTKSGGWGTNFKSTQRVPILKPKWQHVWLISTETKTTDE